MNKVGVYITNITINNLPKHSPYTYYLKNGNKSQHKATIDYSLTLNRPDKKVRVETGLARFPEPVI